MPLCTILTKWPGAVGPDVGAARHAVDVRGDLLEQRAQRLVRLGRTAGHDRRPVERALLAAGNAGADEVQAALAHRLLAADGVGVERVAAVDDDVAFFHGVGELVDDGVGRVAGLDHDDHPPRLLQRVQEFLDGLRPHELALVAVLLEQRVGLGDRPVVQRHGVAVMGEIAGEVRTHHGQAGDADLRGSRSSNRWYPTNSCLRLSGWENSSASFSEAIPTTLWHSGLVGPPRCSAASARG